MDFALSNEQQMLQESARRFFADRHPIRRARLALPWSDALQRELWRDMAGMGWLGLLAPESQAGLQLGMCEAFLIAEAAGRQLLNLPFAASAVLLPLVHAAAGMSVGDLDDWIDEVVAGQSCINVTTMGSLVMEHERQCSHQMFLRGMTDRADKVQWTMLPSGTEDGHQADRPGLSMFDPTLRCSAIGPDFPDKPPGSKLNWHGLTIGESDRSFILDCYRMTRLGEILGAAATSLAMSCDYARQREQFGKCIGSYQAIKHILADAWMALDNARLAALYAVASLDGRLSDSAFACAAARLTSIQAGLRIGRDAIQIHGGIGFTWEHDAHLFLKRIHHVSALLGGEEAAYATLEEAIENQQVQPSRSRGFP